MSLAYDNAQIYNNPWGYNGSLVPAALSGSVRASIRAILQTVPAYLGENWFYQRMTTGPADSPRTYGTPTTFAVHITGRTTGEEYDERRQVWLRKERARLRVSDALADLHQGDQVIDPAGTLYAVRGIESSGVGTIAYTIERDIPLKAGPDRAGGV